MPEPSMDRFQLLAPVWRDLVVLTVLPLLDLNDLPLSLSYAAEKVLVDLEPLHPGFDSPSSLGNLVCGKESLQLLSPAYSKEWNGCSQKTRKSSDSLVYLPQPVNVLRDPVPRCISRIRISRSTQEKILHMLLPNLLRSGQAECSRNQ